MDMTLLCIPCVCLSAEGLPVAFRLGLIGDLGQTDNSASTLDHLTASNPGSVINVGDLSYADGYQPRYTPTSVLCTTQIKGLCIHTTRSFT